MSMTSNRVANSSGSIGTKNLLERFQTVRQFSNFLCEPLSPEDCTVQSMTEASPTKWQLAHTSWFFETFILEVVQPDFRPFHPQFRTLFNSYYNTVGDQHPRPGRGFLTRPTLETVLEYRAHIDRAIENLFRNDRLDASALEVLELGIQHEQQHQELILTDLKHLFFMNPLRPVYREAQKLGSGDATPLDWISFEEGLYKIGHHKDGFAFDNEGPLHKVFLPSFKIANRPVLVREYLEFIRDGGYQTPELWLADGWAAVQNEGWEKPLYWLSDDEEVRAFTFGGERTLSLNEPMCHVSYYEADAFATWAGCRLPTEQEWEVAAQGESKEGNFVENQNFHPSPMISGQTKFFGDVWEWTRSPYMPYPGFKPAQGALGEYNGKFMCNQIVLRGGSCATSESHIRSTYRNFFFPNARWQFSGIRLSKDNL